jgi:UDP-N-acetylglucosamine 2-epimerase (non-hydrolysing)
VIQSDLEPARVLDAIDLAVAHASGRKNPFRVVADYTADDVSRKVVRIILSYTDYVNRTVWRRT